VSSIRKILVANRSEIAIRVMRAAAEMGIKTVAIYANEDRFALHRFKADESYRVGEGKKPIAAYLDIEASSASPRWPSVDAIHPGYGFLSEKPGLRRSLRAAGILFIGPTPDVMRTLGNKVAARNAAIEAGVPVMPATDPLPTISKPAGRWRCAIGYP
jgi:pyruvate carboxylase